MAATMKAVVIHEAGGPEVLKVDERPIPTPQPGWVLNHVKAFGLNRSEMFTRQGHSPVFNALQLHKGETLLIRGGTTSIGLAAAAIAKTYGIKVYSTIRNPSRTALLKDHGVSDVFLDNGTIATEVQTRTNGDVNKVLELIGTTALLDFLQCAQPHGIVCMTGIVGDSWTLQNFESMGAIPNIVCLTKYGGGTEEFMETPLQELVEQIEAGKLEVKVGRTFKLEEIVEAHRVMEGNEAGGKIVGLT